MALGERYAASFGGAGRAASSVPTRVLAPVASEVRMRGSEWSVRLGRELGSAARWRKPMGKDRRKEKAEEDEALGKKGDKFGKKGDGTLKAGDKGADKVHTALTPSVFAVTIF